MKIILDTNNKNSEEITVCNSEQDRGVTILTDRKELLFKPFDGETINIKNLIYNDLFEQLKQKIITDDVMAGWNKNHVIETFNNVDKLCEFMEKQFKIDKAIFLYALEKNRNYCFINYYNYLTSSWIINGLTIPDLHKRIKELEDTLSFRNKKYDTDILELQKKLTEAKGIKIEKLEVETEFDYSQNAWLNCPHCDDYQEVNLENYDNDGDFEDTVTCSNCKKVFNVKVSH
jgi:hypothetical protein